MDVILFSTHCYVQAEYVLLVEAELSPFFYRGKTGTLVFLP